MLGKANFWGELPRDRVNEHAMVEDPLFEISAITGRETDAFGVDFARSDCFGDFAQKSVWKNAIGAITVFEKCKNEHP